MFRKIGKKAGVIVIIMSILGLMGCGSLDERQAKRIEEKLSEMYADIYDGSFKVVALGNRYGTLTNKTITAIVKAEDLNMLFEAKMDTNGEIVADNFLARHINIKLSDVFTKNVKDQGIEGETYLATLGAEMSIRCV